MTATEELRRLLDERGVEWWPEKYYKDECTVWRANGMEWRASEQTDGKLLIGCTSLAHLTPEQAVAATLGSSNCTNSERTETCRRVRGRKSYRAYGGYRIECSACGYGLADKRYRFCPNCGRKVVDE